MKTLLLFTFAFYISKSNAAIIAEPIFELKKSDIKNISVKVIQFADQTRLVKIIGINEYNNFCDMGDRKLKKITIKADRRIYDIYNYQTNSFNCAEAVNEQIKTYLIDSFKLSLDEDIPSIIINGRLINGENNERK